MLFKGTATRTAEDIAQQVDSIGGQIDAFTSKEYAGYYLKVLDEHLPLAVDILADLYLHPPFDRKTSSAKRRSILEEIKMVEDTPDDLVHEIFAEGFWAGSSARPADSRHAAPASRRSIRRRCAATSRRPTSRRTSSSSPSATWSTARAGALLERALETRPHSGPDAEQSAPVVAPKIQVRKKELEQSHIVLRHRGAAAAPSRSLRRLCAEHPLGGSMSSRLFQNVREKRGLAYAVFSGLSAYQDAGALSIYAGCANEAVAGAHRRRRRRDPADERRAGRPRSSCAAPRITSRAR